MSSHISITDTDTMAPGGADGPGDGGVGGGREQSGSADGAALAPPPIAPSLALEAHQQNSRAFASDVASDHVLFRIAPGPGPAPGTSFKINLALVIDSSGSMEGTALDQARKACMSLVDTMGPADFLTVVAYADTASLILPARRVANKAVIKECIGKISAGNTTNLQEGLRLACHQLVAVRDETTLNRIVLLTDGEPTAGVKDFATLMTQASEIKSKGISISTLGLGDDYREELLVGIAQRTGGTYHHVPTPDGIADAFKQMYAAAKQIVARNLTLTLRPSLNVNVRQVFGRQAAYAANHVDIALPDLARGQELNLLCELDFATRPPYRYQVATVELTYVDSATVRPEKLKTQLVYDFLLDRDEIDRSRNADLDAVIETAEAVRELDKTIMAVKRQGLDQESVVKELTRIEDLLRSKERGAMADVVAEARSDVESGQSVPKSLTNAVFDLDQGYIH